MIVRKLEALFGFKIDSAQFNRATNAIDNFAENANTAMAALAGHFAIQTIKDFVDNTTQAMADAGRTAGLLGISTKNLEEMRFAAEKSGVAVDTLDDSLKELQIRAVDAKSGSGEAAEAFKALGVRTTDAAGHMREPLDLLGEVADRLKTLPKQSNRIWVADAMFGDQGAEMLKMLEGGSAGLSTMRLEAQELGYTLSDETVQSAIQFRQALASLKAVLSGVFRSIVKSLLPTLTSFAQKSASMWASLSATFARLSENTSFIRTAFIALGAVLAGFAIKVMIAFAPMLAVGAGIAALALLIDDLWTAIQGGESVSKQVFETIKGWLQSLKSWFSNILQNLWNFLPINLQENLKLAFSLFKSFAMNLGNILATIFRRVFGFVAETIHNAISDVKNALLQIFEVITSIFGKIGPFLARTIVNAFSEAIAAIKEAILGINNLFSAMVPDFVKKGFSKAVDYVGGLGSQYDKPSQQHLAPVSSAAHSLVQQQNQSVNVSVNVKTDAQAHEIGIEVSKAVRKELEKERTNALMGIARYAS
jgi:hypothetical protein